MQSDCLCCRSLVLADPWQPPMTLPTQSLQHLTYLSFLAEGLLVTVLASQFCESLVKLKQLEELQLSRLQLSASGAQMLAQALTELPSLRKLVLTGGAAPTHMPELYVLLNGESCQPARLHSHMRGVCCHTLVLHASHGPKHMHSISSTSAAAVAWCPPRERCA